MNSPLHTESPSLLDTGELWWSLCEPQLQCCYSSEKLTHQTTFLSWSGDNYANTLQRFLFLTFDGWDLFPQGFCDVSILLFHLKNTLYLVFIQFKMKILTYFINSGSQLLIVILIWAMFAFHKSERPATYSTDIVSTKKWLKMTQNCRKMVENLYFISNSISLLLHGNVKCTEKHFTCFKKKSTFQLKLIMKIKSIDIKIHGSILLVWSQGNDHI